MVLYNCDLCNFSSQILTHFKRHCNTLKHVNNLMKNGKKNDKIDNKIKNDQKMTKKRPKMTKNDHKKVYFCADDITCEYCNRTYTSKPHKRRHEMYFCKKRKKMEEKDEMIMEQQKKINMLLEEKVKNMTIINNNNSGNTINNNIIINNYGNEDLSHLTNNELMKMLKAPYSMIENLFKQIYFNNHKPENKTIKMTNKKEELVHIRQNNAWQLENFGEVVPALLEKLYQMMVDFFYESGSDGLSERQKKLLEKYIDLYEDHDDNVMKSLMKTFKMIMINENMREKQWNL